jgi:hypothetical protein
MMNKNCDSALPFLFGFPCGPVGRHSAERWFFGFCGFAAVCVSGPF